MSVPVSLLGGWRVLFAMAAAPEYGAELRKRFTPLMTGVGPVEAAVSVASGLAALHARAELPQLVVSLGSAGSRTLPQTVVYQASTVAYRDMDASPLGFAKGVTPFLDEPAEAVLPLRIPGVEEATLSTGAAVVSGTSYDETAAQMVDMETYACMRACQRFGVPLVALRGISDGAEELHHVADWTRYLHIVDERLAEATDRLEAAILAGTLEPRAP